MLYKGEGFFKKSFTGRLVKTKAASAEEIYFFCNRLFEGHRFGF